MLKVEVVQVEDAETASAVEAAIRRLRTKLGGFEPQAGVVFAGIDSDHPLILSRLRGAFPGTRFVGCTTAGDFSSDFGFSDDSLSIMAIGSNTLSVSAGVGMGLSEDPARAVAQALETALQGLGGPPRLCLVFPNGLHGAPEGLLTALNTQMGGDCTVFGGLSARHWQSEIPTRQFYGDRVFEDALSLLLISGPVRHEFSLCNSWEPVGSGEPVTRARGNALLRIGRWRALDFYRYYLGPHSSPALEFPLAVFEDPGRGFYIRSPIDYHEGTGGILFATPIPEGSTVQLTEATRKRLIDDMDLQLDRLARRSCSHWTPAAALVFSCATRKQILGTWTPQEVSHLQHRLPEGMPVMGFYSYGEISPIGGERKSWLHNCTMVTLLLGEEVQTPHPVKSAEPQTVPKRESGGETSEGLHRQLSFLRKKLNRSEAYRERLERNKDLTTTLLRKINREINAARLEIKRKNELLARTLSLADEIQRNLLPAGEFESPFFDIAGTSVFCSETGGDYYDVANTGSGEGAAVRVVVGDVTGHGIEAALLMTTARALLRGRLLQPGDLAEVMNDVNAQLAADVKDSGRFVTLFLLHLLPAEGRLEWVRAGHDPAVRYDPENDRFTALRGPGVALGVDDRTAFTFNRREGLRPGQVIVLGTDGLWEGRSEAGEPFGKARILETVKDLCQSGAQDILSGVVARFDAFRGERPLEDDVTLVIVKVKALPEPSGR